MKKVFTIVTIVLLAFTANVFAQSEPSRSNTEPKHTAQERTDKLVGEMTTQLTTGSSGNAYCSCGFSKTRY